MTSIETQIAGLAKNTVDNLDDITELKAIDTNSFVLKTKLASDVTTLENKIDTIDKKIPDISGLATKTSLTLSVPRGHPCPQNQMIHIFQLRAVKKIIFGLL